MSPESKKLLAELKEQVLQYNDLLKGITVKTLELEASLQLENSSASVFIGTSHGNMLRLDEIVSRSGCPKMTSIELELSQEIVEEIEQ